MSVSRPDYSFGEKRKRGRPSLADQPSTLAERFRAKGIAESVDELRERFELAESRERSRDPRHHEAGAVARLWAHAERLRLRIEAEARRRTSEPHEPDVRMCEAVPLESIEKTKRTPYRLALRVAAALSRTDAEGVLSADAVEHIVKAERKRKRVADNSTNEWAKR